jgi:putative ABC transport system substrate-binding protein
VLHRRDLLLSVSSALLAVHARAQPAPKVIGVLSPYAGADVQATLAAFRQAMRDQGYAEGRGFTLVERFADGQNERLPALAAELVKLRVDLILASTTNAVKAAKRRRARFRSSSRAWPIPSSPASRTASIAPGAT